MLHKILAAVAIAGGLAVLAPVDNAEAWYCRATSANAFGWGSHPTSQSYARRRALAECAVRTPRNQVCRIRYCR
jgi:hypothetical protein